MLVHFNSSPCKPLSQGLCIYFIFMRIISCPQEGSGLLGLGHGRTALMCKVNCMRLNRLFLPSTTNTIDVMAHHCAGPGPFLALTSIPFQLSARDPLPVSGCSGAASQPAKCIWPVWTLQVLYSLFCFIPTHEPKCYKPWSWVSEHGWCGRNRPPLLYATGRHDSVGNVSCWHSQGATFISVMNCWRHLKEAISSYTFRVHTLEYVTLLHTLSLLLFLLLSDGPHLRLTDWWMHSCLCLP